MAYFQMSGQPRLDDKDFPDVPFHGRQKELNCIKQHFKDGRRIGLISGMPMVGKSRLAREAAVQISTDCQEGIQHHCIDVTNFKSTNLIIDTIFASLLDIEDCTGTSSTQESLAQALKKVGQIKDAHLFICDNADTILEDEELKSQLLDVICKIVRASSKVFFLVTSCRKFSLAKERQTFFDIRVPPLCHDEATDLLTTIAPDVPLKQASEIVGLFGCLPLPLAIARNKLLNSGEAEGYTPEELITLLRVRGTVFESPLSDETYSKSERVGHVLGSAVNNLTEVLKKHYAELYFIRGSFSTMAAAAVTGKESNAMVKADVLCPLRQLSLLEFDDSQRRWIIPFPLTDVVQNLLSSRIDVGVTRRRYCIFFADVLKQIGDAMTRNASEGLQCLMTEFENIEKMILEAVGCADEDTYGAFIRAVSEAERVINQYIHPAQAVPFFEACLNSAMIRGTPEEQAKLLIVTGFAMGNYQGRFDEAYKMYKEAKKLLKPLGESTTLARLYSNLGAIYQTKGQYKKAIRYLQDSLEMWERLRHGPTRGKAVTLATLGITHNLAGNYEKARDYHTRCLEMRIEMCGESHPLIGPTQNNLAIAYNNMGDQERAMELHLWGLYMKRLWFKHPAQTTVESATYVAEQYMDRMEYGIALEFLQEAEQMQKEVGDGEELSVLSNMNLGKLYLHTEQYEEAENHLQKAASWYEKRCGVHTWTAEALEFLGMALRGLGRNVEARDVLTRALGMYEKVSSNINVDKAIQRTRALLEEVTTVVNSETTTPKASPIRSPGREKGSNDEARATTATTTATTTSNHGDGSQTQPKMLSDLTHNEDLASDMRDVFATISENTGYRWKDLARRLGLTEAQIQDVDSKHRGNLKESCMDVLETWKKKEGVNASIQLLEDALVDASLKAIAEEIEGTAEEKEQAAYMKQKMQAVFYTIAENTGTKWKDLARKLGLKPAQIEGIWARHRDDIKECCMDVLETWRFREGGDATVQSLQHALREAGLVDIADKVEMSTIQ